jgi:hypothetical protein
MSRDRGRPGLAGPGFLLGLGWRAIVARVEWAAGIEAGCGEPEFGRACLSHAAATAGPVGQRGCRELRGRFRGGHLLDRAGLPVSVREIAGLLEDPGRPGAPEPTLLPWLAGRVSRDGLERAAAAAAACVSDSLEPWSGPSPWLADRPETGVRWPAIADAVAPVVAARESDPGRRSSLLRILPPAAAHLSRAPKPRPRHHPRTGT